VVLYDLLKNPDLVPRALAFTLRAFGEPCTHSPPSPLRSALPFSSLFSPFTLLPPSRLLSGFAPVDPHVAGLLFTYYIYCLVWTVFVYFSSFVRVPKLVPCTSFPVAMYVLVHGSVIEPRPSLLPSSILSATLCDSSALERNLSWPLKLYKRLCGVLTMLKASAEVLMKMKRPSERMIIPTSSFPAPYFSFKP